MVRKCCCWDLKIGGQIIAWIGLVGCTIHLINGIFVMFDSTNKKGGFEKLTIDFFPYFRSLYFNALKQDIYNYRAKCGNDM